MIIKIKNQSNKMKQSNTNSRVTNSVLGSSASQHRNQEVSRSSHQNMNIINNPSQAQQNDNQSEFPNYQQMESGNHVELTEIKP